MNSLRTNSVSKLLLSETWIEIRACPRWKNIKATNLGADFNKLILFVPAVWGRKCTGNSKLQRPPTPGET